MGSHAGAFYSQVRARHFLGSHRANRWKDNTQSGLGADGQDLDLANLCVRVCVGVCQFLFRHFLRRFNPFRHETEKFIKGRARKPDARTASSQPATRQGLEGFQGSQNRLTQKLLQVDVQVDAF